MVDNQGFTFKQLTPGDSPKLYKDLQRERNGRKTLSFWLQLFYSKFGTKNKLRTS